MNDSATFDYLEDFYGPSAGWFCLAAVIISSSAMLSDIFFISLTLSSKSLRTPRANWFLMCLSASDCLHSSTNVFSAYSIWNGSVDNRRLCALAGLFVMSTATCSFGFPAMIAAERYYKISDLPQATAQSISIARKMFSESMAIPLIVFWFVISTTSLLPMLLFDDGFGEDPSGYCGAKKFTSIGWLIYYESIIISTFCGGFLMTAIHYYRLDNWLKQHQAGDNQDSIKHTRELMRVMKIFTLVPATMGTPVMIMTVGQMFLPKLPMGLSRLLILPYNAACCLNPWLTIALLKPFRRHFTFLLSKAKKTMVVTMELRSTSNVTRTAVQPYSS